MGLYPTLTPGIEEGQTTATLTQPYMDLAQDVLGVDASNLSMINNPLWSAPIDYVNPQTGEKQLMSLDQWKTTLMQNPAYGFQHTQAAMDLASNLVDAIGQTFGKTQAPGGFSYSKLHSWIGLRVVTLRHRLDGPSGRTIRSVNRARTPAREALGRVLRGLACSLAA
jgi:hypothetical protein